MNPRLKGILQVNVAVLLWGGSAMFPKGVNLPVPDLLFLRSLFGVITLIPVLYFMKIMIFPQRAKDYGLYLALGILLGLHWILYYQALRVTAAVAILSLHIYPVLTTLIEPFIFGKKLRRIDIVSAIAVLAGLIIMTPELSLSNKTTTCILLGVISGVFFMARNLLTRKYASSHSSVNILFWQMVVVALMLTFAPVQAGFNYPIREVGMTLMLGVGFTSIPHVLYSAGLVNSSAKTAGLFGTMLIIYGSVGGYLIHNETVALRTIIGGSIILACVLIEAFTGHTEAEDRISSKPETAAGDETAETDAAVAGEKTGV